MQAIKTKQQTNPLSFYKGSGLWHANLPQFLALGLGTKEYLLMADGFYSFLYLLSSNGKWASIKP